MDHDPDRGRRFGFFFLARRDLAFGHLRPRFGFGRGGFGPAPFEGAGRERFAFGRLRGAEPFGFGWPEGRLGRAFGGGFRFGKLDHLGPGRLGAGDAGADRDADEEAEPERERRERGRPAAIGDDEHHRPHGADDCRLVEEPGHACGAGGEAGAGGCGVGIRPWPHCQQKAAPCA